MEQGLILRDIHLPEAISWWPPAPGWWILLALIFCLAFLLLWTFTQKNKPTKQGILKKDIERELEHLQHIESDLVFVEELSALLKRIAISRYGKKVAGFTGEKWLRFLDSRLPDDTRKPFSEGAGRPLLYLPYRPLPSQSSPELERAALLTVVKDWLVAIEQNVEQKREGEKNV